jgi:hypothetical protein
VKKVSKKRKKNGHRHDSKKNLQKQSDKGLRAMASRGKQVSRKTPYL